MESPDAVGVGLLTFVLTLALAPAVQLIMKRAHIFDYPGQRSSHDVPTPRGVGVACAGSVLVMALVATPLSQGRGVGLLVAGGLFALIGLGEDVIGIHPLVRLILQFGVAGLTVLILFAQLATPATPVMLLGGVVAIIWIVAYTNAFNFMDGIDGMSVAQVVVAGTTIAALGTHAGDVTLSIAGTLVVGAALGFAPLNLPRSRAFLGDVGSYFFGAWLSTAVLIASLSNWPVETAIAPILLYIADTGKTLIGRILRGEVWYRPHRQHVYQQLTGLGLPHWAVAGFVGVLSAIAALIGAQSFHANSLIRLLWGACLLGVALLYLASPRWVARLSPSPT